jgi:urease accessory protein
MAIPRSLELLQRAASAADELRPAAAIPVPSSAAVTNDGVLLLLATWLSPAFPVGGFSYSHGLETAIADRRLRATATVEDWIEAVLTSGSGWNDAVLLAEAHRAAELADWDRLMAVAQLGSVMSPSAERHLEASSLGAAFLKAVAAGWPAARLATAIDAMAGMVTYPVAVGTAAGAHGLPLRPTLALFLNGFVANLVSVAVRLVPLGQTAGLKILAGLQPRMLDMAGRSATSTLDDLGSAAMLSDIASMRHETLYSRVFRS